jgi:secreted PhoX family phosphatase
MSKLRTAYSVRAALLAGALSITSCTGDQGPPGLTGDNGNDGTQGPAGPQGEGMKWLSFENVGFARTNAEKHAVRSSTKANVNGKEISIGFTTLLRSRQDPSKAQRQCDLENSHGTCLGALSTRDGRPLRDDAGAPIVTVTHDNTTLHRIDGKFFMINSVESIPAAMFVTTLAQDPANGALSATATRAVDMSPVDGLWYSCAGSKSPWGTHLASEEFPGDGRLFYSSTSWADLRTKATSTPTFAEYKLVAQYWGVDLTDANQDGTPDGNIADFTAKFSPYFHGFAVEAALDANGQATLKKHYAMGRHSMELPYVMPDNKTVLLTDDGTNVNLYMFVADTAGDLSAGTLYAMRAYQTTPVGAKDFTADIEWISLGHATNAEINALLHPTGGAARPTFFDMFEVEAPAGNNTCPTAGFKPVRGANAETLECLKLKPGMELAASRLETRRYAGFLGATNELNKTEGLTYDPDSHTVYISVTDIAKGMGLQTGGDDHINVAPNSCGAVFGLNVGPYTDAAGAEITRYAPYNWYPVVVGVPASYAVGSLYAGNTCSINGIASPDNLGFLRGYNTLIIGEDTAGHQNDAIWSYNTLTRQLTRVMTTPYGAETTAPNWFPDLGGYGYLTTVIQHPYGETDSAKVSEQESTGKESWVGVLGPFPALK